MDLINLQSLTDLAHIVSEKMPMLKFLPRLERQTYKHSSLQGHSFLMQVKTEKQLSTTQSDMQGFVYKIGEIVKYLNNNRLKNKKLRDKISHLRNEVMKRVKAANSFSIKHFVSFLTHVILNRCSKSNQNTTPNAIRLEIWAIRLQKRWKKQFSKNKQDWNLKFRL